MSTRDMAMQIMQQLPDYKMGYVLAYLQGLYADEAADDAFCQQLYEDYLNSEDKGETVSFEEACKACGVDVNAIQS